MWGQNGPFNFQQATPYRSYKQERQTGGGRAPGLYNAQRRATSANPHMTKQQAYRQSGLHVNGTGSNNSKFNNFSASPREARSMETTNSVYGHWPTGGLRSQPISNGSARDRTRHNEFPANRFTTSRQRASSAHVPVRRYAGASSNPNNTSANFSQAFNWGKTGPVNVQPGSQAHSSQQPSYAFSNQFPPQPRRSARGGGGGDDFNRTNFGALSVVGGSTGIVSSLPPSSRAGSSRGVLGGGRRNVGGNHHFNSGISSRGLQSAGGRGAGLGAVSAAPGGTGGAGGGGGGEGAASKDILDVGFADDPNPRFRPTMEDAHLVLPGLGAESVRTSLNQPNNVNTGFFAVLDGHGGKEAVNFIESSLPKHVSDELKRNTPTNALERAFLNTDAAMAGKARYQQCGSTAAALLLRPSESRQGGRDMYVANVGDARAVLAVSDNSGKLRATRLTRDHNPTTPREIDRVRRAGGQVFNGRVNGMLAVSRALGDHALKNSGVTGQPYQTTVPLEDKHKYAIVACDGLWDVVSDQEAVDAVKDLKDSNQMAKRLVDLAMRKGTTDNVSVMAIRLQK